MEGQSGSSILDTINISNLSDTYPTLMIQNWSSNFGR